MLQPRPLTTAQPSRYPTLLESQQDPQLLRKHVPAAWRNVLAIGAAGGMLLSMGSGCSKNDGLPPGISRSMKGQELRKALTSIPETELDSGKTIVSPLFAHGEGEAADGCVVVSPPVFVSEEAAQKIITEELAAAGISVQHASQPLPIETPILSDKRPDNMQMDLDQAQGRLHIEYVSARDAQQMDLESRSSAGVVQSRLMAQLLRRQLQSAPEGTYAVFYDPCPGFDRPKSMPSTREEWKAFEAANQAVAVGLLRQQVRDFVAWYKQQRAGK